MATFKTDPFMCRISRPVRLYNSVYDINDNGTLIPAMCTFMSTKQYFGGRLNMYHITSCDKYPQLAGMWCPDVNLALMPIDMPEPEPISSEAPPDAIDMRGKTIRITGSQGVVYHSHDGNRVVPSSFRVGDEIEVDYAVYTMVNGDMQLRYHIINTSSEDKTLIGGWLLHNGAVTPNSVKDEESVDAELIQSYQIVSADDEPGIAVQAEDDEIVVSDPLRDKYNVPEDPTTYAEWLALYFPGVNAQVINLAEYDIMDHIPPSWQSTLENWREELVAAGLSPSFEIPDRWKQGLLPEDWYEDLPTSPVDIRAIAQAKYGGLKIPDIPEIQENAKHIAEGDWNALMQELKDAGVWEIPKEWLDETIGPPSTWYGELVSALPEEWRSRIPIEWQTQIPPLMTDETKQQIYTVWRAGAQLTHITLDRLQTWLKEFENSELGEATNDLLHKVVDTTTGMFSYVKDKITGTGEKESQVTNNVDYSNPESINNWYRDLEATYNNSIESTLMGGAIGRMTFVHGMPFQFTGITDRRNESQRPIGDHDQVEPPVLNPNCDIYGRSFGREIAASMPVCTIVPGKPKFLTNVDTSIVDTFTNGFKDAIDTMIDGFTRRDKTASNLMQSLTLDTSLESLDPEGIYEYYSLEIDTATYFEYVNSMCHTSARMMGLDDEKMMNTACTDLDWAKHNSAQMVDTDMFAQVIGQKNSGVAFAYDPQGSVSDQISTSTTESDLASKLNGFSAKAREIDFLLGYSGIDVSGLIDTENFTESTPTSADDTQKGAISAAFGRAKAWMSNSLHGMNIKFPLIWADSIHTRSYEIEMHFITPYGTPFCKWRYVLVPFFHAFALAAPRSDNNVSQYRSPFLIRAFSKGYFNVEMGIVENMNWKRYGDGQMISKDGVPLQIDVTLGFTDLYHVLTMTNMYRTDDGTSGSNAQNFFNNTGLMDMIGTLAGVDVNRMTAAERVELLFYTKIDIEASRPKNFMHRFGDRLRNITQGLFGN